MPTLSASYLTPRDWAAAERQFYDTRPFNFTTLDDLLTEESCGELRDAIVANKGWGFLNVAAKERVLFIRNFSSTLIPDVAGELKAKLPNLLGNLELVEYSAFMNRENDGLGIHSDNGQFTLNLYLTPDEFNLDPATGGMTLFDVKRASDQPLHEFNSAERCTPYVRERTRGQAVMIGYKYNRGILFDASTFHAADRMRFRGGHARSHRINLALRFDDRQAFRNRVAAYSHFNH